MMRTLLAVVFLVFAQAAWAVLPDETLADPRLEARARTISKDLRCLQCQNQSIDDSDAPLARDLRLLVRQRIVQGDSDEEVKQFVVARYGTYVLLKPPMEPVTYLLWFGPLLLLGAGAAAAYALYRRRVAQPQPLSDDERRRIESLMERR